MSTVQQTQPQQQSPDPTKKVGSDGEDFSDTANETGTFEVRVQVFNFFLTRVSSSIGEGNLFMGGKTEAAASATTAAVTKRSDK